MEDLGLDYSDSDMTLAEVEKFIQQIKIRNDVERIRIMGGEPFLHPELEEICKMIKNDLDDHPLDILTNKTIYKEDVYCGIEVVNIYSMEDKKRLHLCALVSPTDTKQKRTAEKCHSMLHCGISCSKYGWSPCGNGGAIARLFKLNDFLTKEIPPDLNWGDMNLLCNHCQFGALVRPLAECYYGRAMSKTFKKAFDSLKNDK